MFYGLLIVGGVLLVGVGLLALSWWKRSLLSVVIACILVLVSGFLLRPWDAFSSPTTNDPDEAHWLIRFRFASGIWMLFVVASAACFTRVIRYRRLRNAQSAV